MGGMTRLRVGRASPRFQRRGVASLDAGSERVRMALVESSSDELVALVGSLSSVHMDDYAVVGSYMRFGEHVREQLKDARLRSTSSRATQRPASS